MQPTHHFSVEVLQQSTTSLRPNGGECTSSHSKISHPSVVVSSSLTTSPSPTITLPFCCRWVLFWFAYIAALQSLLWLTYSSVPDYSRCCTNLVYTLHSLKQLHLFSCVQLATTVFSVHARNWQLQLWSCLLNTCNPAVGPSTPGLSLT